MSDSAFRRCTCGVAIVDPDGQSLRGLRPTHVTAHEEIVVCRPPGAVERAWAAGFDLVPQVRGGETA